MDLDDLLDENSPPKTKSSKAVGMDFSLKSANMITKVQNNMR